MAEALYRKYRPQVFADVVGQEPIERTLRNALEQNKISHAYLFCGPRGTGKTTTARLLAKALLCQQGPTPEPDGTCEDCRMIADGVHPDVYELDAASRTGVENMREEVIGRVQFAPTRGRTKVYIIDEVHMLSLAAFNALLKTLEEPPDHVVFILCTTDPQKVPETVHSRCQRFDFRRIAPESMVARLGAVCVAEGVEFEGEALDLIAHRADGGLRNALTSLEQIIAFEGGKVTLAGAERLLGSIDSSDLAEIMAYIGKRDIANCLRWTAEYIETGSDLAQFVRDLAEHVRDLYVMALVGEDVELDVSETMRRQLASELQWFGPDRLTRCMGVLGDLMVELKTSSNPRLSFEIALTRLVRPDSDLTLEALAERVEALESGYSAVAHVLPGEPLAAAAPAAAAASAAPVPVAAPVAAEVQHDVDRYAAPAVEAQAVRPEPMPAERPVQATPVAQDASVAPSAAVAAQEPVAAAEPVSASAASGASAYANPATLQRTWQAVMAAVKKYKIAYGALFMNTRVTFNARSGSVEIEFPPESTFAFNAVQKQEARDALNDAWLKAAGSAMTFVYKLGGETAVSASPAAQPEARPASAQTAAAKAAFAQAMQQAAAQPAAQPAQQQAAAQPMAQQQPAAQPMAQQPAMQQSAAPAYADEPPYDQVPYEEFGIYENSYDGYVDEAPVAMPEPQPQYQPQAAMQPQPQADPRPQAAMQPQAQPQSQPQPEPVPAAQPVAQEATAVAAPDDLEALLQAGFGAGVHFEEVSDEPVE